MLQLGLGLGTVGISFLSFFFPYLKVTNTFVLPSWAEAWCKCDVMRFIGDCLHGSLHLCQTSSTFLPQERHLEPSLMNVPSQNYPYGL